MRALSSRTTALDPYRAGIALGESLAPVAPEVVFLFSSIHLAQPELLEGLYDALENDQVIVVGNTGDGYFEQAGVSDIGAAALALNSDGKVRWRLDHVCGLREQLEEKFGEMMTRLVGDGDRPCFGYLVTDFHVDTSLIEPLLRRWTDYPVIGGCATDNRKRAHSFVYVNRQLMEDAMAMLVASGDLHFSIDIGNFQTTAGRAGRIDDASGTQIRRVEGISAMDFIERETGRPVLQTDKGILTVLVSDPDRPEEKRLRAVIQDFSSAPGAIGLFGGIDPGSSIQACLAYPDEMLANVRAIASAAKAGQHDPVAALIVSCTGRKALLGPRVKEEVEALTAVFPDGIPLAGFPSSGEISPVKGVDGYTRNLFHNMTYVLLLIGK